MRAGSSSKINACLATAASFKNFEINVWQQRRVYFVFLNVCFFVFLCLFNRVFAMSCNLSRDGLAYNKLKKHGKPVKKKRRVACRPSPDNNINLFIKTKTSSIQSHLMISITSCETFAKRKTEINARCQAK